MAQILQKVYKKHASDEVKYYALYGYFFLGLNKTQLSKTYNKSVTTISNWITHYDESGSVERPKRRRIASKFDDEKVQWLLNLYHENPILYLDEAKRHFEINFNITISSGPSAYKRLWSRRPETNLSW